MLHLLSNQLRVILLYYPAKYLVDLRGFKPRLSECKSDVLSLTLKAHNGNDQPTDLISKDLQSLSGALVHPLGIEPSPLVFQTSAST